MITNLMKRAALAAAALLFLVAPVMAQQVANHAIPIGRGPGVVGFNAVAPVAAGKVLASQGTGADPAFTATPTLGTAGSIVGSLGFANATSGSVTIQPVTGALGSAVLSLPAATDTLVGRATTDTLTNKTISGATNTITNVPISTGVSGLGTGIATALGVNTGSAGAPVLFNGAGGTPSAITLTNGTGLPVAGITASTSTALGVGSIELGSATDTTLARGAAGRLTIEGVNALTSSSTDTLTNKTFDTAGTGNSFSLDGAAAQGDVAYFNGTKWTRLGAGSSGQFLKTQGAAANPTWATIAGGGDMLASNNLSDVASKVAANDNIHTKGSDIASASMTDLSGATGQYVRVTGTTTITSFGTVAAGAHRVIQFTGALTITYNATSMILPAAANITTAAGDMAEFVSEGSGNWRLQSYTYATPRQGGVFKITVLTSGTAATHNYDAKAKAARIRMVGGGGGSGGVDVNSTTTGRGGPGGGGGAYVEHFIASALPASATYTVGAGGTAGSTSGTAGGNGGASTYSDGTASLSAGGGTGSPGFTSGISNLGAASGTAGGTASGGNVLNIPGGNSEGTIYWGTTFNASAAGRSSNGGASLLGPGGVSSSAVGTSADTGTGSAPASGYGGGGGGSAQVLTNGTGAAGAAGAGGVIIIEEMY